MAWYENAKIYLDDERKVPDGFIGANSVNQAISLIEEIEQKGGTVALLDLDHDLGKFANDGGDAIKLLYYLIERETFYPVTIHSANPVGVQNMQTLVDRYWH